MLIVRVVKVRRLKADLRREIDSSLYLFFISVNETEAKNQRSNPIEYVRTGSSRQYLLGGLISRKAELGQNYNKPTSNNIPSESEGKSRVTIL